MLQRLSGAAALLDRGFRKSQDVGSPPVGRNVSNIVSKFSIKPLHSNSKIKWISRGLLFSGPSTTKMRVEVASVVGL